MRERYVHFAWIDGEWRPYPMRWPVFRPLAWSETPANFMDVHDGTLVVWIGPYANQPAYPLAHQREAMIPRMVYTQIPAEDLSYPGWKAWHGKKVIAPDKGCAWMYEIDPPNTSGWCRVLWKVWDYDLR